MNQTRKSHVLRPAWPEAIQATALFVPTNNRNGDVPVTVQFLDYAILTVLQVTSVSKTPFIVTDLIVNGEFHPALVFADLADCFPALRWPQPMRHGSSFRAILQAPPRPGVTLASCYPKAPAALVLSTSCGDFAFEAGKLLRAKP
ncbi:MAG: hypothetical protein PHQ12_09650 [Chthoniobacteraceae bacterium]|nr:hypothetical protein [Chthoniobacteraceae bacterium]